MKPKILVIDDDRNILHAMKLGLRSDSYQLLVTDDIDKALMLVEKHEIAVVVCDHLMPKLTGVEVLSKIKTMAPFTMRILLTGECCLDDTIKSINEANIYRYLQKPCTSIELKIVISKAITKHKELIMLSQLSEANYTQEVLESFYQYIISRKTAKKSLLDYKKVMPGMKLVKDLKAENGTLLAKSGHTFTQHDLTVLKSFDIKDKILIEV